MDTRVVIEPFAEGIEFTVIVLHNPLGLPVAILPTEIETDYTEHQIFDFRKSIYPRAKSLITVRHALTMKRSKEFNSKPNNYFQH